MGLQSPRFAGEPAFEHGGLGGVGSAADAAGGNGGSAFGGGSGDSHAVAA